MFYDPFNAPQKLLSPPSESTKKDLHKAKVACQSKELLLPLPTAAIFCRKLGVRSLIFLFLFLTQILVSSQKSIGIVVASFKIQHSMCAGLPIVSGKYLMILIPSFLLVWRRTWRWQPHRSRRNTITILVYPSHRAYFRDKGSLSCFSIWECWRQYLVLFFLTHNLLVYLQLRPQRYKCVPDWHHSMWRKDFKEIWMYEMFM